MKPYKADKAQKLWRKYLNLRQMLMGGDRKLFEHYAKGIELKQLSSEQKESALNYWNKLIGTKVDLRWHQLLYSTTGIFKPSYMPFDVYGELISRQIPSSKVMGFFDDKSLYRYFLRDFNMPHRIAESCNGICYLPEEGVSEVPFEKVAERLVTVHDCIIKPSKGSSAGIGVRLLNTENGSVVGLEITVPDLLRSYRGNFVVENKIEESECLSRLNPTSCNTLRIHTWRNSKKEKCEFISAYVRIGREGSIKDNASAGGITCQVMEDGTLGENACTVTPYKKIEKTDVGVNLAGYHIEGFIEMLTTAVKAHSCLPMFGIIGWDICMGKDGRPIIIEFNPNPDMRIEQLVFCDTCLLDKQEEIIKEVFD